MPSVLTSIRLPQELYDYLSTKADCEKRTISNLIVYMLMNHEKLEKELFFMNEFMDVYHITAWRDMCKKGDAVITQKVQEHPWKMTLTFEMTHN